jgi:hypothetical protein
MVSFLASSFLAGGLLVGLPILIHLLARQRSREMPWAAFQFLMAGNAAETARSKRMTDFWLMLLRALLVACLVLAFAQPVIQSRWLLDGATERIFILDQSLSMGQQVDGRNAGEGSRTAMSAAIDRLQQELDNTTDGDTVRILLASDAPRWLTASAVTVNPTNRQSLSRSINSIAPTEGSSDFVAAMRMATRMPRPESVKHREIYFLTDGTSQPLQDADEFSLQEISDEILKSKNVARAAFIDVSQTLAEPTAGNPASQAVERLPNLFVSDISLRREMIAVGESVVIKAQVTNAADLRSNSLELALLKDGRELQRKRIAGLESGVAQTVQFRYRADETGLHRLRCQIVSGADDRRTNVLADDDMADCWLRAAEPIFVLLVDGARATGSDRRPESGFMAAALGDTTNLDTDGELILPSLFQPTVISTDQLPRYDLREFAAVVLLDCVMDSESQRQQCVDYVDDGGGLWVIAGDDVAKDQAGRGAMTDWLADLGISAAKVTGWLGVAQQNRVASSDGASSDSSASMWTVVSTNSLHPLSQLLRREDFQADALQITGFTDLQVDDPSVDVIASTSSGQPLLVSPVRQRGQVLLQTLSMNRQGSLLPLKNLFVPWVEVGLGFLVSQQYPKANLVAGESAALPPAVPDLEVELPDGRRRKTTIVQQLMSRFGETVQPGDYRLVSSREEPPLHQFIVGRKVPESSLTSVDPSQIDALSAAGIGWQSLSPPVAGFETGRRITDWLFALAMLFLLGEWFFARKRRALLSKTKTTDSLRQRLQPLASRGVTKTDPMRAAKARTKEEVAL